MQQEACHCPQRKKINLRRVLRPVAGFNVRLQRSQLRVSRLGRQPSSSPVAVCTHLLIRSRQPPCRNVWRNNSEPQHQPESFFFAKNSRKTSNNKENKTL